MASTYRSTTSRSSDDRASHEELSSLLQHLGAYGLTLVSVTVRGDVYEVVLSGDVPSREVAHLNLEKV